MKNFEEKQVIDLSLINGGADKPIEIRIAFSIDGSGWFDGIKNNEKLSFDKYQG
jgi:hypothetical protein